MDMGTVDRLGRAFGRAATAARIGARTLAGLDTNPVPGHWQHITKIDPEVEKKLPLLYPLYLSHTSAISVGGSSDVTSANTEETLQLLDCVDVPVFHEPSDAAHVTKQTREYSDFLAIPEVLNGHSDSLIGSLGEGAEYLRDELVPGLVDEQAGWLPRGVRRRLSEFATSWLLERAVFEAYIIQNPESAAAREANVTATDSLTPRQAAQRALAAERHLESEVIYIEYSGMFGGDEAVALLEAVSDAVSWSRIWYGGGLDARAPTAAILAAGADAVVVGNVFHDIAEEEVELCRRAAQELDVDASEAAIQAWVEEAVTVEELHATRYLATVPDVAEPAKTAEAFVTATIRAWLELRSLLIRAQDTVQTVGDLHRYVEDAAPDLIPERPSSTGVAPAARAQHSRDVTAQYLADELGLELETLPGGHIGAFQG